MTKWSDYKKARRYTIFDAEKTQSKKEDEILKEKLMQGYHHPVDIFINSEKDDNREYFKAANQRTCG